MFLHNAIGFCLEWFIELLVRATGRSVRKTEAPWLSCFLGKPGLIGTGIYDRIAAESGLRIRAPKDAGLIADFNALRGPSFDPYTVRPEIRDFYEHTAKYHLDVWTEVSLTGRSFLWLLVEFISRRMDQLNFPISSLEVAKGMSSEVIQLYDPNSGDVEATGWLRRLKSSGNVIYAGIYSVVRVPGEENPCVKVTFPCRGSANVYLRPVAHSDGSFGLDSSGSGFGRSGFYRIVDAGPEYWRVRISQLCTNYFMCTSTPRAYSVSITRCRLWASRSSACITRWSRWKNDISARPLRVRSLRKHNRSEISHTL